MKFVVDAAAPFDELSWSQHAVTFPLNGFAQTYGQTGDRHDAESYGPLLPGGAFGGLYCPCRFFFDRRGGQYQDIVFRRVAGKGVSVVVNEDAIRESGFRYVQRRFKGGQVRGN